MKKKSIRFNLTERKGNNRPPRFLNTFMTAFLLLWSVTATAQRNITKSPALERLLQQIEQNYVPQQWNQGMDDIAITVPILYVQLVGYAMYNQQNYIDQGSSGLNEFNNLNQEIISMTPQIAKAYNKTNSNNINFEFCNPEELQAYYIKSKNGILSQNFTQHYREQAGKDITQINIPFILDEGAEPLYIKAPRKDDAIVLLGVEANEVIGLPSPGYIYKSFPEDFIVGTWTNEKGESVTFNKRGNIYIGIILGQEEYNDGWEGYTQKKSIRRVTMTHEVSFSELRASSEDPKNPNWYMSFTRWYSGKCTTTYVPHVEYTGGPVRESTFYIYWDDKNKRFTISGHGTYYRR